MWRSCLRKVGHEWSECQYLRCELVPSSRGGVLHQSHPDCRWSPILIVARHEVADIVTTCGQAYRAAHRVPGQHDRVSRDMPTPRPPCSMTGDPTKSRSTRSRRSGSDRCSSSRWFSVGTHLVIVRVKRAFPQAAEGEVNIVQWLNTPQLPRLLAGILQFAYSLVMCSLTLVSIALVGLTAGPSITAQGESIGMPSGRRRSATRNSCSFDHEP